MSEEVFEPPKTFYEEFVQEVASVINRHSQEKYSNTPDFVLAAYLYECLVAFETAIYSRDRWYGRGE